MHKDGAARAVLGCLALPAILGWCSWCEGFQLWREGLGTQISLLVLAEELFLSSQLLCSAAVDGGFKH